MGLHHAELAIDGARVAAERFPAGAAPRTACRTCSHAATVQALQYERFNTSPDLLHRQNQLALAQ